jgi:POLQ-like helicase
MRREASSNRVAAIVRSKDKMVEFRVPVEHHLQIPDGVRTDKLFPLAIGFLGDYAAEIVDAFLDQPITTVTDLGDVAFSARTLSSYAGARLSKELTSYLLRLSSASFYLCDMPGSALVQIKLLTHPNAHSGLDQLLEWLLERPWHAPPPATISYPLAHAVCFLLHRHYRAGVHASDLRDDVAAARREAYSVASDNELLLTDLICAISIKRFLHSARKLLLLAPGSAANDWEPYLRRGNSLHELWPSQRMLADAGVLAGRSAVVQMPTSVGKTKGTELILRAGIAAERVYLAILVAPFVALCDEICVALRSAFSMDAVEVSQLGDVLQTDYTEAFPELSDLQQDLDAPPHVVVLTPEKLLYILRQKPELSSRIDLLIYDEGHQFDSGARGVTYELLLTSIKIRLRSTCQTVLISAVIENPDIISRWLLRHPQVVSDRSIQASRSIAFTSRRGQLHFQRDLESDVDFFVPRVMPVEDLSPRKSETRQRVFPDFDNNKSVAIYLAAKLVPNGGVAIFCGKKSSVPPLLSEAIDIFSRAPATPPPSTYCDEDELQRLCALINRHYGESSYLLKAARLGIFSHHGSTPRGLRLAIEHAMRERKIGVVACTSTLAQGVNLPIRYLLVTATRQGKENIRLRDFRNLMGRAGRAGMYGEGTIIFTDPDLRDNRESYSGARRWRDVNTMLRPEAKDPIGSSLLELTKNFLDERDRPVVGLDPVQVAKLATLDPDTLRAFPRTHDHALLAAGIKPDSFAKQFEDRIDILDGLQSYLLANLPGETFLESDVRDLARSTLAYHIADETERERLSEIFEITASYIFEHTPTAEVRRRYGQNLLGVRSSKFIDSWIETHHEEIIACETEESLLQALWPLLTKLSRQRKVREAAPATTPLDLALLWISGEPIKALIQMADNARLTYPHGRSRRRFSADDIGDVCESFFGFDGPLFIAAARASLASKKIASPASRRNAYRMDVLQKRLKYGLPSFTSVCIYEAGFSDRVVAQDVERKVWGRPKSAGEAIELIREWQPYVEDALFDHPSHFTKVFRELLTA